MDRVDPARGFSSIDRILRATPDSVKFDQSIAAGCRDRDGTAVAVGEGDRLVVVCGSLVPAEG